MSTTLPELPAERAESFGDNLAGMASFLIDPAGAARRVFTKWFWVGPLVIVTIISIIAAVALGPIVRHAMESMPLAPGITPEQQQRRLEIGMKAQMLLAPVMPLLRIVISALIVFAMCSVLTVNAKFRNIFNLMSGASLISIGLTTLAIILVLKSKGEVSTMAELQPALGLDIFMPEGANKYLVAFLGYFSVFEIWWIVMVLLVFSRAFRVSKGKAFAAILPLILLSLVLKVLSAAFQRT